MVRPLLLALLLVSGCQKENEVASTPSKKSYSEAFHGQLGDILDNGDLVLHVLGQDNSDPHDRQGFLLKEDYGIIVFNGGSYESPEVLIRVASRSEGWIKEVANLPSLQKIVSKLPSGKTFGLYGSTCGGPTWYGIPHQKINEILSVFQQRGLTKVEGFHQTACTCPNW